MRYESAPTYWVKLYLSGPIEVAKQTIRKECLEEGLCVTIDPTLYIYSGGEEQGFVVGFLNYPRFPSDSEQIIARARKVADKLLESTAQFSYLLETPEFTQWITFKPENIK